MRFGGLLAQYAADDGAELGRAVRQLIGQILGFVLVVLFALWLIRRSRKNAPNRPPVSGWYADPWGAPYQRWWNGAEWTGNIRDHPWPGPPPGPGEAQPGQGWPPAGPGGPPAGPGGPPPTG